MLWSKAVPGGSYYGKRNQRNRIPAGIAQWSWDWHKTSPGRHSPVHYGFLLAGWLAYGWVSEPFHGRLHVSRRCVQQRVQQRDLQPARHYALRHALLRVNGIDVQLRAPSLHDPGFLRLLTRSKRATQRGNRQWKQGKAGLWRLTLAILPSALDKVNHIPLRKRKNQLYIQYYLFPFSLLGL